MHYTRPLNNGQLGSFNYVFNYTDHLGNVRISFARDPQQNNVLKILEENHYYPFGLKHTNYNSDKLMYVKEADVYKIRPVNTILPTYKYKYNGQELQEELGLNVTAMDFRQYDNALGRFLNPDRLSELAYSITPYRFAYNNPNIFADPSGLYEEGNNSSSFIVDKNIDSAFKGYYKDGNGTVYFDPNVHGQGDAPTGTEYLGETYKSYDGTTFWDEYGKPHQIGVEIEEVVIQGKINKKNLPSFNDYVSFSTGMGGTYLDARWGKLNSIALQGKFIHSNGKIFNQNYLGGRWHNVSDIKTSKAKFNSNVKFLGRLSTGMTLVGAGATIYDGATNGWENHHTADLVLTTTFYYIAASCGPFGWVAGATYFVGDMVWQAYSGESITESLLDD